MKIGMMAFSRLLVYASRLCKAVNRLADVEEARLVLEQARLNLDHPTWEKPVAEFKKTEIATADVAEWNKNYYAKHPEEEER